MGPAKDQLPTVLSPEQLEKFKQQGCLVVPNFLSLEDVESLRKSCYNLIENMDPTEHVPTVFSTTQQNHSKSNYFLDSGDKVRFFFEAEALDDDGKLKVDKQVSLNKIGHALHWLVPEFKKVSFSQKMKATARQLGFVQPAIVQSMYIFKQPGIGGEVTPHKDCTFLSTDPQSCIGFWFALEDATLENGCLWYSPGSHKYPTERRFIRNPDKDGPVTIFNRPPDPHDQTKYIPMEVPKGTLVLINGQVDHLSAKNTSTKSRHIYTFHVIEQHNTKWDPNNWLQPTPEMAFTGLYENNP